MSGLPVRLVKLADLDNVFKRKLNFERVISTRKNKEKDNNAKKLPIKYTLSST